MAVIYLDPNDTISLHRPGSVYGARGAERVLVYDGVQDARVSSTVEQVHFQHGADRYALAGVAGSLEIWLDGVRLASLVVGDGQEIRFANGTATVIADPNTGGIALGGSLLGSAPSSFSGYLDASKISENAPFSPTPPPAPSPDGCEINDSLGTATQLPVGGSMTSLSIHSATDQDYFRISLRGEGTASAFVGIDFAHAHGDLNMDLLNASGRLVREGRSLTDGERISLDLLPAGEYYAHVYGVGGAVNGYSLSWNADVPAPPRTSEFSLGDGTTACIVGVSGLDLMDFRPLSSGRGLQCVRRDIVDAEKTEATSRDDDMCWGAVAANMLTSTGWGAAGLAALGFSGPYAAVEDNVFQYVKEHHDAGIGNTYTDGVLWFANQAGLTLPRGKAGSTNARDALNPAGIAGRLLAGEAVGIVVHGAAEHALTCYGFVYDSSNGNVADPSRYVGLIVADSDNSRLNTDPGNAPNSLTIVDCSMDGGGIWHLDNYLPNQQLEGRDLRIVEVDYLAPYA